MAARGWHGGAVLVLVAAGLLMAAGTRIGGDDDVAASRGADLVGLVERQTGRIADLEARTTATAADVERLGEQGTSPEETRLLEDAASAAVGAGFTPLEGPGVTVTLTDAPVPADLANLPTGTTPDDFVVHQQDVEGVVNALWTGGAEGLQIMDRRITNASAVRCVGNVIILDGQVYSPPFTITAVGDPDRLSDALDDSEQVSIYREWAAYIGLGFEVTEHDAVVLPAATGPTSLSFATTPEPA
jgi:uncharacterized protein YlxW (UPF0749 family)